MDNHHEQQTTRVLKVAQCPSLSGRSLITYQVGCREGGIPHLRVCANTGKGAYSNEWVATTEIAAEISRSERVTAAQLSRSLYPGKSANSGGFLLAVLKDLGLIDVVGDRNKTYVQKDAAAFVTEVRTLLDAGVDLPMDARVVDPSPKPPKKVPRAKRATSAWPLE